MGGRLLGEFDRRNGSYNDVFACLSQYLTDLINQSNNQSMALHFKITWELSWTEKTQDKAL